MGIYNITMPSDVRMSTYNSYNLTPNYSYGRGSYTIG